MKANAPEKIFLEWYRVGDEKYRDWVITPKTNNEPIQYTRTDAFIEKACEYLEPILTEYAGFYVGGDILQHFEKYMKGE